MFNILAQAYDYTYTTTTTSSSGGISPIFWIIYIVFIAAFIAAMWKIFVKAGQEGWKSIIPIYNSWVLFEIAGKPGWWIFLSLIPLVNIYIAVVLALELASKFGKTAAFGIFGLFLFSVIGYLILGFGDAKYQGGATAPAAPAQPAA